MAVNVEYEYDRYLVSNPSEIMSKIDEFGVAIISNVINDDEILNMRSGIWNVLEHLTQNEPIPIDRNNEKSWSTFYEHLGPKHSMLVQQWVGHSQISWDIRTHPKVIECFASIWGTDDLLVSFDGLSVHFPPEITKIGWKNETNLKPLHTDQSFTRPKFECIQSWITAYDINQYDATLTILEKSNHYHKEFSETFYTSNNSDFVQIKSQEQQKFYTDRGCVQKAIRCPAGSMVFWDSRTIHSGIEASKERLKPNLRNIIYICMQPKDPYNYKELQKKKQAFFNQRTCSHYPNIINVFSKYPKDYNIDTNIIVELSKPIMNKIGLKLAGFDENECENYLQKQQQELIQQTSSVVSTEIIIEKKNEKKITKKNRVQHF